MKKEKIAIKKMNTKNRGELGIVLSESFVKSITAAKLVAVALLSIGMIIS